MPYTEIFVATPVFFVHKIDRLYIPVYRTYKSSYYDEQMQYWYSFGQYSDDPDLDVSEIPGVDKLDGINYCSQRNEWEKVAMDVIGKAINMGYHPDNVYPDDLKAKIQKALKGDYEPEIPEGGCPECGNTGFYALQKCRLRVIVDQNNNLCDNVPDNNGFPINIFDKNTPQGPYACTLCGKEYSYLPNGSGMGDKYLTEKERPYIHEKHRINSRLPVTDRKSAVFNSNW